VASESEVILLRGGKLVRSNSVQKGHDVSSDREMLCWKLILEVDASFLEEIFFTRINLPEKESAVLLLFF
jgi:hypothetical protein